MENFYNNADTITSGLDNVIEDMSNFDASTAKKGTAKAAAVKLGSPISIATSSAMNTAASNNQPKPIVYERQINPQVLTKDLPVPRGFNPPPTASQNLINAKRETVTGAKFNKPADDFVNKRELKDITFNKVIINTEMKKPCTFTYSNWAACLNGVQTRTATPNETNCFGTPSEPLSQNCTSCPDNSTLGTDGVTCYCNDGYTPSGNACVPVTESTDTSGSGAATADTGYSGGYTTGDAQIIEAVPTEDITATTNKKLAKVTTPVLVKDYKYYYIAGGIILVAVAAYFLFKTKNVKPIKK